MFFRSRLIFLHSTKTFGLHRRTISTNDGTNLNSSCTICDIPNSNYTSYPPEILEQIDQGNMIGSVEKHRRHLCIGQSISSSQWPKDVKDLPGGYIKELTRILKEKNDSIGYSIKLTSTSIIPTNDSEQTADWYLFPDQIKLTNVNIKHLEEIIQTLFVNDQSIIKLKDKTKTIEEQLKENNHVPRFNEDIKCERLYGLWLLVCCHYQRDQRCGVIGPMLINEIEKYVRETNLTDNVHWLKISHIGGHRFAGNLIVYPSGTWYGRVLTNHIPLIVNAYVSSSDDLKERLKPLLRGYLDTT